MTYSAAAACSIWFNLRLVLSAMLNHRGTTAVAVAVNRFIFLRPRRLNHMLPRKSRARERFFPIFLRHSSMQLFSLSQPIAIDRERERERDGVLAATHDKKKPIDYRLLLLAAHYRITHSKWHDERVAGEVRVALLADFSRVKTRGYNFQPAVDPRVHNRWSPRWSAAHN